MALTLTQNAKAASQEQSIEMNLIFEIDEVATIFGAIPIKKFVRIGDPDLEIGDPEINPDINFYIGGFNLVKDQKTFITFDGTTTTLTQQLQQDKGASAGVSTFNVSLIDKNEFVTALITPDLTQSPPFDLLGRKCRIYLGFKDTAWPEDHVTIFRGVITEMTAFPGRIQFLINHPDNKKRSDLFVLASTELAGAIDDATTTIVLADATDFLVPIAGPSGTPTANYETYVRIDDEVIQYTGISGNTLTGVVRGALTTVISTAAHDDETTIDSFHRIKGNIIDISLQLMHSGINDYFVKAQPLTSFNIISPTSNVPNAIFFDSVDLLDRYGLTIGDYVTTTGSAIGANNVTLEVITGIVSTNDGDYITIDGVTFADESDSAAVIDFRSQYDVYPDGMKMNPDEIDIEEHLKLRRLFLSSFEYDFYIKDTIEDGKEFLEQKVYSPAAAFSLPRKARASVGFHSGPIPGTSIQKLDDTNIKDPAKLGMKRSTNRNFYSAIVYRFDEDLLEDRFLGGVITQSGDSISRIKNAPSKNLNITASGMRTALSGKNNAVQQSNRRLKRYEFGAETVKAGTTFGDGFAIEIGDIAILDGKNLKLSDITKGNRDFEPRLISINNKKLNLKTGDVQFEMIDTNFDGQGRYGLISAASLIKAGISTTKFQIKPSFNTDRFGINEFQKWVNFVKPKIKVRSADFSRNEDTTIINISGNTFTVEPALTFTPWVDDIIELMSYDNTDLTTDEIKLVYTHMQDNATFADGKDQYIML